MPEWLAAALRACGLRPPYRQARILSGGCISRMVAVETGDGSVCVKTGGGEAPDFFLREREGLEALARAGSSLRFPRVFGHCDAAQGPSWLALEYLAPGPPDWEALGRGLAELHRFCENRYGFYTDNYLGATPQENGWSTEWGEFFATRRIAALVRRLDRAGALTWPEQDTFTRLLDKIPHLVGHRPAASLIHGDLWNGNHLPSLFGPTLIDPAVSFSDREADWAMLRLFGGFPDTVFEAYQETWPLPSDWKDRLALYQLYHLLNHQLLFGGGYGAQALASARRYL